MNAVDLSGRRPVSEIPFLVDDLAGGQVDEVHGQGRVDPVRAEAEVLSGFERFLSADGGFHHCGLFLGDGI